ncbi:MAG: hypothetical protein IPM95_05975 [Sphingobacteriales bacterium]|jgi:hypothetical protein|nr:hypothetical protein [Sphingobacteriales bacterium]
MSELTLRAPGGDHYQTDFLSWFDGIDAMLKPAPDAPLPNVLVHVARITKTPVGMTPGGMLLINPENKEMPDLFGFICEDEELGKYYGPKIFKGTPFENAPVLIAKIFVYNDFPRSVHTKIEVAGHIIELELSEFDGAQYYYRTGGMPFTQHVVEAAAHKAVFKFDGKLLGGELPPDGIGGGLPAVFSPSGMYYI